MELIRPSRGSDHDVPRNSLSNSPCSTRAAERRHCGELRTLLHWGLLFIARASRLYRPRPGERPRGHGELLNLKLLRCDKVGEPKTDDESARFAAAE